VVAADGNHGANEEKVSNPEGVVPAEDAPIHRRSQPLQG
jgi:hypothetical protein